MHTLTDTRIHHYGSDVVRRFGSAEEIVAVGDSREEEDAAKRTGMDFIKIIVPEVRSMPCCAHA